MDGGHSKNCKCTLVRKEFSNFSLDDFLVNWEACMMCSSTKGMGSIHWPPPPHDVLNFDIDDVVADEYRRCSSQ